MEVDPDIGTRLQADNARQRILESRRKHYHKGMEKLKADPDKLKAFQIKRASQQKKRRLQMNLAQPRQSMPRHKPFKHKVSLKKAVEKSFESLPSDPVKARQVLIVLGEKFGLKMENPMKKRKRNRNVGTYKLVDQFFQLDFVSRQLPGIKDCMKILGPDGKSTTVQKRHMIMTIEQAYEEFMKMFPTSKICYSNFAKHRPKFLILMKDIPHNTCCCIYCSNMDEVLESLSSFKTCDSSLRSDFVLRQLMCDRDSYECASGSCEQCRDFKNNFRCLLSEIPESETKILQRWEIVDKFTQKIIKIMPVTEILTVFDLTFEQYKLHKYYVRVQSDFFTQKKMNLHESEALIIVDYSQNYTTTAQDEVQSAYFSARQISVFTAFAYVGDGNSIPFVIVNDDTQHSKEQAWFYMKLIITELKKSFPALQHVQAMSDGCAAQFKNRFNFLNLLYSKDDFDVSMEWNFFATSHGKSPADGIGGTTKRGVYRRVLTGKWQVYNASDFAKCAESFSHNIKVICVSEDEMKDAVEMLQRRWNNVRKIQGTKKFHHFTSSDDKKSIIASFSSKQEKSETFRML